MDIRYGPQSRLCTTIYITKVETYTSYVRAGFRDEKNLTVIPDFRFLDYACIQQFLDLQSSACFSGRSFRGVLRLALTYRFSKSTLSLISAAVLPTVLKNSPSNSLHRALYAAGIQGDLRYLLRITNPSLALWGQGRARKHLYLLCQSNSSPLP